MNNYKIVSILHNGKDGERGSVRTEGTHHSRVGRIIQFDWRNIKIGKSLVANYIKDENGNDYFGFGMITSIVKDLDFIDEGVCQIETLNSIYVLEQIDIDPAYLFYQKDDV